MGLVLPVVPHSGGGHDGHEEGHLGGQGLLTHTMVGHGGEHCRGHGGHGGHGGHFGGGGHFSRGHLSE